MDKSRELTVRINGDTSGFERAMGNVQKESNGLTKAFNNAKTGSFALMGALTAAAGASVFFGINSVQAYNSATEAATKLRTNLLNVEGATLQHVAALRNQASQLQAVGVIEDDVITAGQAQLATFKLQASTIQALTPKIADMVAQLKGHNATAEDMVAINNLVGKVMTGNVGALSRYGVTLSENQKELLKQGNEAQRAAVLNEVLAQNYGKVNEALRDTPQGKITALKNAWGDLQEDVGALIYEIGGPLIEAFSGWISEMEKAGGMIEYFSGIIERNKTLVFAIAGAIMVALVPALVAMGVGLYAAFAPLLPFIAIGAALGLLIKVLADRFGGLGALFEKIKPLLETLGQVFKQVLWPAIQQLFKTIATELWPALQKLWDLISPVLLPVLKVLAVVIGVTIVGAIVAAIKYITLIVSAISKIIDVVASVIRWIVEMDKKILDIFFGIAKGIGNALSGVYDAITGPFRKAFDWITSQTDKVKGALNKLNPWAKGSPSLVDYVRTGTRAIQSEYSGLFDAISSGSAGISGEGLATNMPGTSVSDTAPAGPPTVFQPSITVNLGMYAGMPVEKRQIAVELYKELQREARANGVTLQPIGVSPQ